MNKYQEMDNTGREIVTNLFQNQQLVAGTTSDVYDLSGSTITQGDYFIEVKYRPDMASTTYKTDIMEYKKLNAMRGLNPEATCFYIMLFKDQIARCYNLNNLKLMDLEIDNMFCPSSSVEDKGYQLKLILKLPTNKAKTYKWN